MSRSTAAVILCALAACGEDTEPRVEGRPLSAGATNSVVDVLERLRRALEECDAEARALCTQGKMTEADIGRYVEIRHRGLDAEGDAHGATTVEGLQAAVDAVAAEVRAAHEILLEAGDRVAAPEVGPARLARLAEAIDAGRHPQDRG